MDEPSRKEYVRMMSLVVWDHDMKCETRSERAIWGGGSLSSTSMGSGTKYDEDDRIRRANGGRLARGTAV